MRLVKKKLRARQYADLSFQFYRDKEGTPKFLITRNESDDGKPFCTGVDTYIFAKNLVESDLISVKDLSFLCDLFDKARQEALQKFNKPDPLVGFTTMVVGQINKLRDDLKK